MKKYLVAALLMLSALFSPLSFLQAKPVSSTTALSVAQNVLHRVDLKDVTPTTVSQYYIFVGADDHGFAIVAADDCSMPLLAYSTTAPFSVDNMAPATKDWLASYARQIDEMRSNGVAPSDLVTRAWSEGHSLSATTKNVSLADSVPQLLTTTWSQSPYYNDLCPFDTTYNERAVTGCGATATAQVMKYWNFPTTGYGSHGYVDQTYGYLFANFDSATYLWDSMPNALTAVSSATQVTAVASLMSDVGIAIEMGYGVNAVGGSWSYIYNDFGAPSIENGLNRFFKYRSTLHHFDRDEMSESDWDYYLKADLSAGRPIIYRAANESGDGHIFVCDGYDAYGAFHFNWGWGGYADGYFYMGALNIQQGYYFNYGHVALVGIEPDTTFDATATVAITPVVTSPLSGFVWGGGNYHYGDTVILLATANPGYRFVGWANGVKENPIEFYATDSRTDSALFVPMTGDTLGYTDDLVVTRFGIGRPENIHWGIKLPAESFDNDHVLTAVQMFCDPSYNDSVYYLSVYSGGDSIPQTLVYVDSMMASNYGWVTFPLDSAVVFNQNEPLWITMRCYGSCPATVSYYSGNPGSIMWNGSGRNPSGWHSLVNNGLYYSFMLRAVMGHGLPAYTVTTASNVDSLGTTTGDGIFPEGSSVTIEAIPAAKARFLYWSDGSTDSLRTIVVSCDTLLTAYFEEIDTIQGIYVVDDVAEMGVLVNGRIVSLSPDTPGQAVIYDAAGRRLAVGRRFKAPAAGVYIVSLGNRICKVVLL